MKQNLDKRSQIGLVLGILAVTLVIMLALYIPAGPRRACLKSQSTLDAARADLQAQLLAKMDEADRLSRQKQLMELLAKRPAGFEMFAYVDGVLNKQGLRDRAQLDQFKPRNVSPAEPMVQLRLEGVAFDELISFFHGLYSSGNVIAVYKMESMRPANNGQGLDCDVTLMTLTAPAGMAVPAATTAPTPAEPVTPPAPPAPTT